MLLILDHSQELRRVGSQAGPSNRLGAVAYPVVSGLLTHVLVSYGA